MNVVSRGFTCCRLRLHTFNRGIMCLQPSANIILNRGKKFVSKNKKDGVDMNSFLVYNNSNRNLMYSSLLFTSLPLIPGLAVTSNNLFFFSHQLPHALYDIDGPLLTPIVFTIFGGMLVWAVHRIMSVMPSSIYYNQDENKFTIVPLRLTGKENFTFKPHDVMWRENKGMLANMTGNVTINGRVYYISKNDFKDTVFHSILTAEANRRL